MTGKRFSNLWRVWLRTTVLALVTIAPATQLSAAETAGWTFTQDRSNPAWSATATFAAPVLHGVTVDLVMRCEEREIIMIFGVGGTDTSVLPEPRRTVVTRYTNTLYIDRPVVKLIKGSKPIANIAWSNNEGGHATLSPGVMAQIVASDGFELHGGPQVVRYSNANLKPAVAGIVRQCRMRVPGVS